MSKHLIMEERIKIQALLDNGKSIDAIITFINQKILEAQWSPEQISSWLKKEKGEAVVSHTWIYNYIKEDKAAGGELHNHLRIGGYYNSSFDKYLIN